MQPNMNLSPSVPRELDEEYDKFLSKHVLSADDLAWFENAFCEGDDAAEYAYWEEKFETLREEFEDVPSGEMLDYAADDEYSLEEFHRIVYGDNPDPLPDSYDEMDVEREIAYQDHLERFLSSEDEP